MGSWIIILRCAASFFHFWVWVLSLESYCFFDRRNFFNSPPSSQNLVSNVE